MLVLLWLTLSLDQFNHLDAALNIIRVKPDSESCAAGLLLISRSDARFKHSNIPGKIAREYLSPSEIARISDGTRKIVHHLPANATIVVDPLTQCNDRCYTPRHRRRRMLKRLLEYG